MSETLTETENIETLSEDVQEIIGKTPGWILRWGIATITIILILLIGGSMIFKYPDVIDSEIIILSQNPPIPIVAHSSGKISDLLVQNGQFVIKGDPIAVLENTANYSHITSLIRELKVFEKQISNGELYFNSDTSYILGPIQPAYSSFFFQLKELSDYMKLGTIEKKIDAIQQQKKDYANYSEKIETQSNLLAKTVNINHNQYKRDSLLNASGTIAHAELEKSEQAWLISKNNYQNNLALIANNQIQINQLQYSILELDNQKKTQLMRYKNLLLETYQNLVSAISEWEMSYVLRSPIEGKVTFNNYWTHNQFVKSGESVFDVVPFKLQQIVGRIRIPISGSGKVEVGQKVLIYLDNYPYIEYGMLEGRIDNISLLPAHSDKIAFYTAEVGLIKGLTTTYNIELPFIQEMNGTGKIITKKLTLFERLINPVRFSVSKNF